MKYLSVDIIDNVKTIMKKCWFIDLR